MVTHIVAADIGGTNARFARASLDAHNVPTLGRVRKYKVSDFSSLIDCWNAYARDEGDDLPKKISIAFATAIGRDDIRLTNSDWTIKPSTLATELGVCQVRLVNDFEAVGHAIAHLPPDNLPLIFGHDIPFPRDGGVTILGPGTGLGVAMIGFDDGHPHVFATEGGHIAFTPLDAVEEKIVTHLQLEFPRISVERVVSGPGLNQIYQALSHINDQETWAIDDAQLWASALDGSNSAAQSALDRFMLCFGSVAGDLCLAHGPNALILAGSLTQRMLPLLPNSGFHRRFTDKGRFTDLMGTVPIRFAQHDDIGLYGAAAAFREK